MIVFNATCSSTKKEIRTSWARDDSITIKLGEALEREGNNQKYVMAAQKYVLHGIIMS